MTDSEAPERIWAGRSSGIGGWHEGPDFVNSTEYVRADMFDAIKEGHDAMREALTLIADGYVSYLNYADPKRRWQEIARAALEGHE